MFVILEGINPHCNWIPWGISIGTWTCSLPAKDSVKGDTRKGKTKVKSAPKGRAKSAAKPKTKESKKQPAGQSKDKTTKTRSVTPYGEAKKASSQVAFLNSNSNWMSFPIYSLKLTEFDHHICDPPFRPACLHPRCREDDPKIRAKQIEILWKESKERKEIVAGLPESEQKRRRYI